VAVATAPGAAKSFVLARSTSADFSTDLVTTVVTADSDSSPYITFNDSSVSPDTSYFYQVLANNAGGTTAEPDTAPASTILAAPSNLTATADWSNSPALAVDLACKNNSSLATR
jgi:phosphodiesterase/alkaline phosphatase D-like protein